MLPLQKPSFCSSARTADLWRGMLRKSSRRAICRGRVMEGRMAIAGAYCNCSSRASLGTSATLGIRPPVLVAHRAHSVGDQKIPLDPIPESVPLDPVPGYVPLDCAPGSHSRMCGPAYHCIDRDGIGCDGMCMGAIIPNDPEDSGSEFSPTVPLPPPSGLLLMPLLPAGSATSAHQLHHCLSRSPSGSAWVGRRAVFASLLSPVCSVGLLPRAGYSLVVSRSGLAVDSQVSVSASVKCDLGSDWSRWILGVTWFHRLSASSSVSILAKLTT
ncbi:hypothetical protein E1301_Tti024177 [Triplophysa tibetana]|uniref:Uncharacterized protein n=1 Tax=Triplophysa tibetana TaxID=1572043 RepID=A0A5A9N642_9TELE|nr:hypothetical protein E1301_Tti024177 [Triplophysa tibetana]